MGGSGNWIKSLIGKKSAQIKDQSEFLGLIIFFFLFLGGFDLVPSVCFRMRVVVMGREN